MQGENQKLGAEGEEEACLYLLKKGYRKIASNFRTRFGEIDLIMEKGSALIFVEVKKRSNDLYGEPEESVVPTKKSHLAKAALHYILKNDIRDRMIQFDVVSLGDFGIRHYPNAFETNGNSYY